MRLRKSIYLILVIASLATRGYAQISWSNQSPAGISDDVWSVTYANNTFAAVTNQGRLLTSNDGLTWSSQTIDGGVWLVSIAYGNGIWVVVGDKGTILFSSDLKTWLNATSVTSNKLNGVYYNGPAPTQNAGGTLFPNQLVAVWVAVGENGTIVTSPDAKTWTLQPPISGVTSFLHGITNTSYAPVDVGFVETENGFLVCGADGVFLTGSPGGDFGSGNLDSVGAITSDNLEAVLTEPNAATEFLTVAVGSNGALLYGAGGAGRGALGPPAFNLSPTATPDIIFRGLAYGNGYWVAAGEQGTIFTSADGINWIQRFSGDSPSSVSTSTLLSAAYSSTIQRFVVTGTGGTILVSNSAPTVFGNVSTRGYVSPTETFIGGFVVQGTAPRTVLIRGDGPVLSTFSVPSPLSDPVVTVYNGAGAVVATNTGWATSANPAAISTAALEVGAFALPSSSADSALLLTLPPGAYTVQITSAKGNSGIALFEAYTD